MGDNRDGVAPEPAQSKPGPSRASRGAAESGAPKLKSVAAKPKGVAAPDAAPRTGRSHDPDGVKRDIIAVSTAIFADRGFSGARIDEIAAATSTSKRMIYYYFGDKEGLFVAVLEEAYARIRAIEASLDLRHLDAEAALRALVAFTFDYQNANEDFIRLVMVENIHKGVHLARSNGLETINVTVIDALRDIYARGLAAGAFRPGVDEIDLHMTISALCFFNVANRSTFSRIFKREMGTPEALARRREIVVDTVLRFVRAERPADENRRGPRIRSL